MSRGRLSGREAVAIMVEEIGAEIGTRRVIWFEKAVRKRVAQLGRPATGQEWISAMAHVIVDADDQAADRGFQRGIRRIRELAARRL